MLSHWKILEDLKYDLLSINTDEQDLNLCHLYLFVVYSDYIGDTVRLDEVQVHLWRTDL
jgi:hypothetical protein